MNEEQEVGSKYLKDMVTLSKEDLRLDRRANTVKGVIYAAIAGFVGYCGAQMIPTYTSRVELPEYCLEHQVLDLSTEVLPGEPRNTYEVTVTCGPALKPGQRYPDSTITFVTEKDRWVKKITIINPSEIPSFIPRDTSPESQQPL